MTWTRKLGSRGFLLKILGLQLIFYVAVFVDIPVARQVIGFVYLTFAPGVIIIRLLKLDSLSLPRKALFSAGFSIAFLMFAGLLLNIAGRATGILRVLSPIPLIMTLSPVVLLLALVSCFGRNVKHLPVSINRRSVLLAAFSLCLPVIAIVGALLMNFGGNNSVLLLLMIAIPIYFSASILWKKLTSPKIYAFIVLVIALALLFHSAFVSNYLMGADVQLEYHMFARTTENRFWNSTLPQFWDELYGRFNSMLSITILPAIYHSILDIDPTWILKIIYPLVFCLVPVGLFLMWGPYVGGKRAFLSAFLFMSQLTFYTEMIGLCRQMMAEFFLVLLFMLLLSRKITQLNKNVGFIAFGAALIVSHYSVSYIFMLFIAIAWAYSYVLKRNSRVNLVMVIIFFVMTFSWYIYTSNAGSFQSFLEFGNFVVSSAGEFANPASRGEGVLKGIGLASSPTPLNTVSRIIAYVIEAFIVLGFVSVATKRTNIGFKTDYIAFAWVSMGLLAASILLPGFAQTLNVERFYHISLFLLSPFCVIGAEVLIGILTGILSNQKFRLRQKLDREMRRKPAVLLMTILVLYFLFQTNFLYEVAGSFSSSIPLSKQRIEQLDPALLYLHFGYVDEYDVFGARWLAERIDLRNTALFADRASMFMVLRSYGRIYSGDVNLLSNSTKITANATIYMNRGNIVDGFINGPHENELRSNTTLIFAMLKNTNKVYANGACEVYQKSG